MTYGGFRRKKRRGNNRELQPLSRQQYRLRRLSRPERIGWEPTVEEIADSNFLLAVFDELRRNKGTSAGPDGIGMDEIGRREMAEGLRLVRDEILYGDWRPGPTREVAIPKLRGGKRTLHIPNAIDRVVFSSLERYMAPFWEHFLLDGCHGSRPRRSHLTLLADLEKTIIDGQRFFVATDDIRKAFDSVHLADVDCVHDLQIEAKDLRRFIAKALRGNDPGRAIGIDQGSAYSPLALNALLDKYLDQPLNAVALRWRSFRFVDNLFFATCTMTEAQEAVKFAADCLRPIQLELRGEQCPQDIRMDPVEVLGFSIRAGNKGLEYGFGNEAWNKLGLHLEECHLSGSFHK